MPYKYMMGYSVDTVSTFLCPPYSALPLIYSFLLLYALPEP